MLQRLDKRVTNDDYNTSQLDTCKSNTIGTNDNDRDQRRKHR